MKPSFGKYKNTEFEDIPDGYLCWICAAFKGGFKAKFPGDVPFTPPDRDFFEARRILVKKGYNTRGTWPVKDTIEDDRRHYG